jgi:uncharacterized membrane protein
MRSIRPHPDFIWQFFWPLLATAGAIIILAIVVAVIRSWWRENDDDAESCGNLLTQYREMHEQGELTDEEYRLIKSRIARGPTAVRPSESGKHCR